VVINNNAILTALLFFICPSPISSGEAAEERYCGVAQRTKRERGGAGGAGGAFNIQVYVS